MILQLLVVVIQFEAPRIIEKENPLMANKASNQNLRLLMVISLKEKFIVEEKLLNINLDINTILTSTGCL
jgi:hypothetical protein